MQGVSWRRPGGAVLGAMAGLLACAAGAFAATPATTPAHPPDHKPALVKAHAGLALAGTFTVQGQPVTVPGRAAQVRGVVRPYAAHQRVQVTVSLGSRVIRTVTLPLRRSPGGTYGWFELPLASPSVGQVQVTATHAAAAGLGAFRATTSFAALQDQVGFGSTGRFVELLQQRLAALHFYVRQTGVYDTWTGLALDAYHRLLHWGASQALDRNTVVWLLNGWGAFPIRYPRDGRHAEGNLSLQLLALIDHGQVLSIYPISSGKPSTPTILGRFHVYLKTPGYLPDGMYYSNFFSGGYAIHGYDPAPDYPASHGCMRVPIVDATSIYGWIRVGDGVDVYY